MHADCTTKTSPLNLRSVTLLDLHSTNYGHSFRYYRKIPNVTSYKAALFTMTLATIPEDPEREARRFRLERRHPPNEKINCETWNQRWYMDRYSGTIGVPLLCWELPTEPISIDAKATRPANLMEDLDRSLAEDRFRPKSSAWTEWFVDSGPSPSLAVLLILIH